MRAPDTRLCETSTETAIKDQFIQKAKGTSSSPSPPNQTLDSIYNINKNK